MGDEIVRQAATEAGWVAGLLCLLVVGIASVLGWFIKQLWTDQTSLRTEMSMMRQFQQDTLIKLVETTQVLMVEVKDEMHDFRKAIENAPCGANMAAAIERYIGQQHKGGHS